MENEKFVFGERFVRQFFVSVVLSCCLSSVTAMDPQILSQEEVSDVGNSWRENTKQIWKSSFKTPLTTGAFTASSKWVAEEIIKNIVWGNVLEIGAGSGPLSVPIADEFIENLCGDGQNVRLDIIECDKPAYKVLEKKMRPFTGTHREICLYNNAFDAYWCPSGVEIKGLYDTVISTVPLTTLSPKDVCSILSGICSVLKPGGRLIFIMYWHAYFINRYFLCCCPSKDRKVKYIFDWLEENFNKISIKTIKRNLPPMTVFVFDKKDWAWI